MNDCMERINIGNKRNFIGINENNHMNTTTLKDCLIFCIFYNYNFYIYKLFINQKNKGIDKLIFHIRMLFINPTKSNTKVLYNLMEHFDFSLHQLKIDKKYAGIYETQIRYYQDEEKNEIKSKFLKLEKNIFKMDNPVYEIPFEILQKKNIQILSKIINYSLEMKSDIDNYKKKILKIKINKFPKLLVIKLNRSKNSNFCTNFIFPSFFIKKKLTIFAIVCNGDITNKNYYTAFVRDKDQWYQYDCNKNPILIGTYLDLLTKFESKHYVLEQSEYIIYSEYNENDLEFGIKPEKYYLKVI